MENQLQSSTFVTTGPTTVYSEPIDKSQEGNSAVADLPWVSTNHSHSQKMP